VALLRVAGLENLIVPGALCRLRLPIPPLDLFRGRLASFGLKTAGTQFNNAEWQKGAQLE